MMALVSEASEASEARAYMQRLIVKYFWSGAQELQNRRMHTQVSVDEAR